MNEDEIKQIIDPMVKHLGKAAIHNLEGEVREKIMTITKCLNEIINVLERKILPGVKSNI